MLKPGLTVFDSAYKVYHVLKKWFKSSPRYLIFLSLYQVNTKPENHMTDINLVAIWRIIYQYGIKAYCVEV